MNIEKYLSKIGLVGVLLSLFMVSDALRTGESFIFGFIVFIVSIILYLANDNENN